VVVVIVIVIVIVIVAMVMVVVRVGVGLRRMRVAMAVMAMMVVMIGVGLRVYWRDVFSVPLPPPIRGLGRLDLAGLRLGTGTGGGVDGCCGSGGEGRGGSTSGG